MDVALSPPLRIQTSNSHILSTKVAHSRIDNFLADFQRRYTPAKGTDTTVTVQLQKLSQALKDERKREKEKKDGK